MKDTGKRLFFQYNKEREFAINLAQGFLDKGITYRHSGHVMTGVVTKTYERVDRLKVKSRTGREYTILFLHIIAVEGYSSEDFD